MGVAAPIDAGPIDVVASAVGYVTVHKNARAAVGETVEIKVQLEKEPTQTEPVAPVIVTTSTVPPVTRPERRVEIVQAPQASHGLRDAGFVLGGIGIAGMGVCATFFALAQTRFDQLKTQCGGGPCDASYTSQINEGQTFQTIGNVALAAGGTAIVTGAIMIIAGLSTRSTATNVQAAFTPLAGGGWLAGVGRAF
jgi:hypothetical protein